MPNSLELFTWIAPPAALGLIALGVYSLKFRRAPAVQALLSYLVLVVWLLITTTGEIMSPPGELTLLFSRLQYISYLYQPVAWLSFCLRYTGYIRHQDRRLITLAFVGPLTGLALVMTDPLHHLLWSRVDYVIMGTLSILKPDHGIVFWGVFAFSWVLTTLGTVVAIRAFFGGQSLYYRQSLWVMAGAILPGIFNLIYVFRLIPGMYQDFTPLGYAASGYCFLAAIFLYRMLWVTPVARSAYVQDLDQAILVLDKNSLVLDYNSSFDRLLAPEPLYIGTLVGDHPVLGSLMITMGIPAPDQWHHGPRGQVRHRDRVYRWTMQGVGSTHQVFVLQFHDITESFELRQGLEHLKSQFVKREKLAAIGRLAAGMAHEINNPLAFLKSHVRSLILMTERSPVDYAEDIVRISQILQEGLGRIDHAVSSLLAFARQGEAGSTPATFDLNALLDRTVEFVHFEIRNQVDFQKHYGAIPPLEGQVQEINQVLFNIIINAVQAVKDRVNAQITMTTGHIDDHVWCEISNNGPPIPEENQDKIFELFYTTKPEQWGTGLGLNLSRDIIETRHGGSLVLRSCNPVVFRIELPCRT